MIKEITPVIETVDGFKLNVLFQKVADGPGTIIMCHGITVDLHEGGFFDTFADSFLEKNISVFRFDYRGHGKSDGTLLDVTLEGEKRDIETLFQWLISNNGKSHKFAIVAASFSCASALHLAINYSPMALVLLNPVFSYKRTFVNPEAPWGMQIEATKDSPILPHKAKARIPDTEMYLSEELWREMENDQTPEIATRLFCPTLAFHGDSDTKVPIQPILDFVKTNPNKIKLEVLKGEQHGFKGRRPEVISKTIQWIKERL